MSAKFKQIENSKYNKHRQNYKKTGSSCKCPACTGADGTRAARRKLERKMIKIKAKETNK